MNNQMQIMLQQLKANPMQMLAKRFNLPENLPKDPQDILQYLLNSGQISQQQVDNAMQMRKMLIK